MPEEFFSKMEATLIAQMEQDAEIVERANRHPPLVRSTHVDHETAGVLQHTLDKWAEWDQPIDILRLVKVAISLLMKESKWRRSHQEIDRACSELLQVFLRLRNDRSTKIRSVQLNASVVFFRFCFAFPFRVWSI